jgi:hypothetical protein
LALLSLRSSHTFFLIILVAISIPVAASYAYPEYVDDAGYLAVAVIMSMVVVLPLAAYIQGRAPHITHVIFDPKTKAFYRSEDFFVEDEPRGTQPALEVWPIMGKDPRGNDLPSKYGGRWWYPYLVKTKWGVSFGDYHDAMLHIFVLPHPWKKFLGFHQRNSAAYLFGEEITSGNSTVLCSILAPFKRDFVGVAIPTYVGILSHYTMVRIMGGGKWEEAMNEWARLSQDVDRLLKEKADEIFPKNQLDELIPVVYPELKRQDDAKSKRPDLRKVRIVEAREQA